MSPRGRAAGPEAMVAALGPLPPSIARAMSRVPRHCFLPAGQRALAYEDEPLPLEAPDSTISAPHMVAIQLEAATLRPGHSVLEIGSGSGYLLALIAEIVGPDARVVGIELEPTLAARSRVVLDELGYRSITVRLGDGREGAADLSPFDRIIVSCATAEILEAWRHALAPGGRIVAPVGGAWSQTLMTVGADPAQPPVLGPDCRFVALRRGPARPPAHI